ncbi:uncharacterized protein LOC135494757 [Lineus longissimus]|uniref:uncharacterized protein LOC135494757 n=1 Tax=Lineus longissimus TaxID=88925 RepID=UPI00315D908A
MCTRPQYMQYRPTYDTLFVLSFDLCRDILDKMPDRCVAGGCNNVADKRKGIMIHRFPKDERIRAQWVRFVAFKRKNFSATKHSVLCSGHFNRDCYFPKSTLVTDDSQEAGYRTVSVWMKSDDAVPTVFDSAQTNKACGPPPPPNTEEPNLVPPPTGLARSGRKSQYRERKERMSIVQTAIKGYNDLVCIPDDNDEIQPSDQEHQPEQIQMVLKKLVRTKVQIESFAPVQFRNVSCQVSPDANNMGCQTKTYFRSESVQCTLIGDQFVHIPADLPTQTDTSSSAEATPMPLTHPPEPIPTTPPPTPSSPTVPLSSTPNPKRK